MNPALPTLTRDRREAERLALRTDAKTFPRAQDCVVIDISAHGARIRFEDGEPDSKPKVVVFWKTGQAFEVSLAWRRSNEIGVRFLRTCRLDGHVAGVFKAAQAAWRERLLAPPNREAATPGAAAQIPPD